MYSIQDYSVNYFLRNASHIYACTHPNPKLMIWPKRPPLAFFVAETSVAEMSGPKRPRPKCPWPKCPTFGPEPMYEEMRVPPWGLSISPNLSLLNAYKWAFVLVGFCPSGLLS